ncbi:hypothetical protein BN2476_590066 [Paraburkholderia piptadeniae]|uniref:Uncharacterized protein n=1 Tax=Paraburkholderia piptadeniae TaxID=1701573 RepID=A0A1N7SK06_9BURK|nr:hypothetical protein BN2476_590066 [Paraburkholderia piptadeniae]
MSASAWRTTFTSPKGNWRRTTHRWSNARSVSSKASAGTWQHRTRLAAYSAFPLANRTETKMGSHFYLMSRNQCCVAKALISNGSLSLGYL